MNLHDIAQRIEMSFLLTCSESGDSYPRVPTLARLPTMCRFRDMGSSEMSRSSATNASRIPEWAASGEGGA